MTNYCPVVVGIRFKIDQMYWSSALSTTWCRAFSNESTVDEDHSVGEMNLREVFGEDDDRLDRWMKDRLNTTLGRLPDSSTPTQRDRKKLYLQVQLRR